MKNLSLALLLVLAIFTVDAGSQSAVSQVASSGSVMIMNTLPMNRLAGGVDRASFGHGAQAKAATAHVGRSESEILKDLYRERYQEPFWKR
jgi:hypothetical protein